jgi:hypothetical protein
LTGAET